MKTIDLGVTLCLETCIECGIQFAFTADYNAALRRNHQNYYCPNGHSMYYPAETDAEKLHKQLMQERQKLDQALAEASELRGKAKKTRCRIGNGVCPCCNRTFADVQRHMKTKHPDYAGKAKSP